MTTLEEQKEALANHFNAAKRAQDIKRDALNRTNNGTMEDGKAKPFKHSRETNQ